MPEPVEVIHAAALDGVPHGFFGRRGGVSIGVGAGLNAGLGSADDPAAVAQNRACAAAVVLPGAPIVSVYQIHSADCVVVEKAWSDGDRPRADALATRTRGVLLGVLTADCAPVLLMDREAGVVAAAHAGWRGALAGVTERTLEAMESLGARRSAIAAAIGPCIAQPSYEVDQGFADLVFNADSANAQFLAPGANAHHQFDLEGYVAHRLQISGVRRVERLRLDTYSAPDRFFSYRRATHAGQAGYGRQISLIGLA